MGIIVRSRAKPLRRNDAMKFLAINSSAVSPGFQDTIVRKDAGVPDTGVGASAAAL